MTAIRTIATTVLRPKPEIMGAILVGVTSGTVFQVLDGPVETPRGEDDKIIPACTWIRVETPDFSEAWLPVVLGGYLHAVMA